MDIGSGALPGTWRGWQSRNLLNVVTGARKCRFYRLSQVIRRKLGFVETNQAQDSTSRKLLCAFRFIFSLQIKNLAPQVCYKVLLGQRDLEKQQQQPTGFPWHLGKKALSLVCFSPTPWGIPLWKLSPLATQAFKSGVEGATCFIFVFWWEWKQGSRRALSTSSAPFSGRDERGGRRGCSASGRVTS